MSKTAIKERPILFSGEMVRAILDGHKTQTRRAVKLPKWAKGREIEIDEYGLPVVFDPQQEAHVWIGCPFAKLSLADWIRHKGPPKWEGRLWVRETFSFTQGDYPYCRKPSVAPHDSKVWYRASNDRPTWAETKWHPSIFMPRWASRLTLEVTDVHVERLRDISEADAFREGVKREDTILPHCVAKFRDLWESINGKGSWDQDPWVWVVSFERVEGEQ